MTGRLFLLAVVSLGFAVPATAEDKFFNSNGVRIRYVDEGAGEPVILLHGFLGNVERWTVDTRIFEAMRDRYRLIAFDSRGNGKSDKPHDHNAYGMEMGLDALRLLDHLKIPKAHFVGFSFGGTVVAKLLTTHPERILTAVIGGNSGRRADDQKANEEEARQIEQGDFRNLFTRLAAIGAPPPTEEAIQAYSKQTRERVDVMAIAAMVRGRPRLVVTEKAQAAVRTPTLAVVGSLDPNYEGVQTLKRLMPSLQVVVIEGAGHGASLRHPDFVRAVHSFINAHSVPSQR